MGQGLPAWYTNQILLCSRAKHRFYILHSRRGMGFCRFGSAAWVVFIFIIKIDHDRRKATIAIFQDIWLWGSVSNIFPRSDKRWHDHRFSARNRYSAALYQLWRFL